MERTYRPIAPNERERYLSKQEAISLLGESFWGTVISDSEFFPDLLANIRYKPRGGEPAENMEAVLKDNLGYFKRLGLDELSKRFNLNIETLKSICDEDETLLVEMRGKEWQVSLRGLIDHLGLKKEHIRQHAPDLLTSGYIKETSILLSEFMDPADPFQRTYSKETVLQFYHAMILDLNRTALHNNGAIHSDSYNAMLKDYAIFTVPSVKERKSKEKDDYDSDTIDTVKWYEHELLSEDEEIALYTELQSLRKSIIKMIINNNQVVSKIKKDIRIALSHKNDIDDVYDKNNLTLDKMIISNNTGFDLETIASGDAIENHLRTGEGIDKLTFCARYYSRLIKFWQEKTNSERFYSLMKKDAQFRKKIAGELAESEFHRYTDFVIMYNGRNQRQNDTYTGSMYSALIALKHRITKAMSETDANIQSNEIADAFNNIQFKPEYKKRLMDYARKELPALAEEYAADAPIEDSIASLDQVKYKFAMSNMRFVLFLAKKKRWKDPSVKLNDLVQEGFFGLIKAIDGFDHERGFQFSTYAGYWIEQNIDRHIQNTGTTIRIPVHIIEELGKYKRAMRELTSNYEKVPSLDDISARSGMTKKKILELKDTYQALNPISISTPIGDGDAEIGNFLAAPTQGPEELAINSKAYEKIISLMQRVLKPREFDVITQRIIEGRGLEETSKFLKWNVTKERVRQIEKKGLLKMKMKMIKEGWPANWTRKDEKDYKQYFRRESPLRNSI